MKRAILAIALLALTGCSSHAGDSPAIDSAVDPHAADKLGANLANFSDSDWYPALTMKDGKPWIEIDGTIAFVHFAPRMDGAPLAEDACHLIAAVTNDGDTAKPLGITSVVIAANGQTGTQCQVP